MQNAFSLIKADRDAVKRVASNLANVDGVSEVHAVTGRYDLVAVIEVSDQDELRNVLMNEMLNISGIVDSETLYAVESRS